MSEEHKDTATNREKKRFGFFEALGQAFSLIFALQNHSGRKRLLDLAETNPLPLIISGLCATVIFFLFCFITSQVVIGLLAN